MLGLARSIIPRGASKRTSAPVATIAIFAASGAVSPRRVNRATAPASSRSTCARAMTAPASTAARARSSSTSARFTTSARVGIVTSNDEGLNRRRDFASAAIASSCGSNPARSSTRMESAINPSPQTFSRGYDSRSNTTTPHPRRARCNAAITPAGPPPTTATSHARPTTRRAPTAPEVARAPRRAITRGYMVDDYDIIVLGSGVTASLLASELRTRFRLLVLDVPDSIPSRSYASAQSSAIDGELAGATEGRYGDQCVWNLDALKRMLRANGGEPLIAAIHSYSCSADRFTIATSRGIYTGRLVIDCLHGKSPIALH